MPTYEYECDKCGAVTDVFQSMSDKPRRKLKKEDNPVCKCNTTVTRLIGTGGGIIFKGSGFYKTDYRNENYKKSAEADKPSSESKSDEKKPAQTKESKKKDSAKKESKVAAE